MWEWSWSGSRWDVLCPFSRYMDCLPACNKSLAKIRTTNRLQMRRLPEAQQILHYRYSFVEITHILDWCNLIGGLDYTCSINPIKLKDIWSSSVWNGKFSPSLAETVFTLYDFISLIASLLFYFQNESVSTLMMMTFISATRCRCNEHKREVRRNL